MDLLTIVDLIAEGEDLLNSPDCREDEDFEGWRSKAYRAFLLFDKTHAFADALKRRSFEPRHVYSDQIEKERIFSRDMNATLAELESLREELITTTPSMEVVKNEKASALKNACKIFLVHGNNNGIKETVARFLEHRTSKERLIILHEQSGTGDTIIEKFERYTEEAGYAVVIMSADDEGRKKKDVNLQERARQNVIFEFGFFVGKLGRNHVTALLENGVEMPSDIHGVQYISYADDRPWREELERELGAAGII